MKRDYKKFHALLAKLTNVGETLENKRAELVLLHTGKRTGDIKQANDIEFAAMLGAMEAQSKANNNAADNYRKMVIAAIGGWLKLVSPLVYTWDKKKRLEYIKSIACRSAQCEDFNKIQLSKLRALHFEYTSQQQTLNSSKKVMAQITAEIQNFKLN